MNRFLAFFLLVNLTFAHLPPTPAGLRRSAVHKRRLDDAYLSPAVGLRRRSGLDDIVDSILGPALPPPPSDTSTSSSDTPASTPPPSSSSSSPASSDTLPPPTTSNSVPPSTSNSVPPSTSDSVSPSTTSDSVPPSTSSSGPTSSASDDCLLGLGVLCPSSSPTPSSTNPPPSSTTNDPQSSQSPSSTSVSSDSPPSQTSQPPSTTDSPPSTTGDLCALLGVGCSSSSTPVSSNSPPSQTTQPPSTTDSPSSTTGDLCALLGVNCPPSSTPSSSNIVLTQSPPASTDTATTPPSSATTGDLCALLGVGCSSSSVPASSDTVSNPPPSQTSQPPSTTDASPPSTTGDLCILAGVGCPSSSVPASESPPQTAQPSSTADTPSSTGDLCALFGIGCTPSSTPASSGIIPTQSPPAVSTQSPPVSSSVLGTDQPLPSTTGDLCVLFGIGCSPSSTPASSGSTQSSLPSASSEPPISSGLPPSTALPSGSETTGSTQFPSSQASLPPDSSLSSDHSLSFPSGTPPPSSSGLDSVSTPSTTLAPPPSNTQFAWLTQSSLIFSSFSVSALDSMSLTDPDQVPTPTSFSTTGTPTAAPSVVSLPSGMPARIVPGFGGADPGVDDLSDFTLIAILFDLGLNWVTVVQNTDSPGQIFSWLPPSIIEALSITSDQVKSYALQVYIPNTYQDPKDADQLGTTWLGFVPTRLVDTLAAQIKVRASPFYTGLPSPYSDLTSHVDPAFAITTITTTGIPGSGGASSNNSSGGASTESRTRENAIIGVVSTLGGLTLIVLGYLVYRAIQKRKELAHRRLSDPPNNPFVGEAPPNRNFDQDSIGGQRRRSFYFAEDSLRGFSDYSYSNDGARLSPEQATGLNRRQIAGNIGPPVMRENSLNF